jgi:hypothetical protein
MPDTYGKIIRNGVNYSHDTAESISYDNTTSEMTATDIQDAIDELKSDIDNHQGGHTILDTTGTAMTDRANLQFVGPYVTDDSTNDKTVVNVVRNMTEQERGQLSPEQEKGFISTTGNSSYPLTSDLVAYGSSNVTDALDDLYTGEGTIRSMTESEYEDLDPEEQQGIIITDTSDNTPISLSSGMVVYSNTTSGLTATDVQAAIDELAARLAALNA